MAILSSHHELRTSTPHLTSCTSIKNRVSCQENRLESLMYRLETRFFCRKLTMMQDVRHENFFPYTPIFHFFQYIVREIVVFKTKPSKII
jgi:hypothetical protein